MRSICHERQAQTTYSGYVEVRDDKWTDVFLYKYSWAKDGDKYATSLPSKPKIVQVLRNEKLEVTHEKYWNLLPPACRKQKWFER